MMDAIRLTELPSGSLRISTQCRLVRIDDATHETEQCYLTIEGSPDGFRWLAQHLASVANTAEQQAGACGNIVAAWDFANEPIQLDNWDSLDFSCRS